MRHSGCCGPVRDVHTADSDGACAATESASVRQLQRHARTTPAWRPQRALRTRRRERGAARAPKQLTSAAAKTGLGCPATLRAGPRSSRATGCTLAVNFWRRGRAQRGAAGDARARAQEALFCRSKPKSARFTTIVLKELDADVRETLCSHKAISHSDEYYNSFCELLIGRLAPPEAAAASRAAAAARNAAADAAAAAAASAAGVTQAQQPAVAAAPSTSAMAAAPLMRAASQMSVPQPPPPPPPPPPPQQQQPYPKHADVTHDAILELQRELRELRRELSSVATPLPPAAAPSAVPLITLAAITSISVSALALAAMVLARQDTRGAPR